MAYTVDVDFYETKDFTRIITELLSDEEYLKLQKSLVVNPKAGNVIAETGGVRKLRWVIKGRGKRGGVRVIYYYVTRDEQIFMLYAYSKKMKADLTKQEKKALAKLVREELS